MLKTALTFGETELPADPFAAFHIWLGEAERSELNDPNAMALATVDADGLPDVRTVLLKGVDPGGFVFYTNFESRKGQELLGQPKAALCFHWKSLRRQVRVRGTVEIVSDEEADAYYRTRARISRLGAWASQQSRPLASRAELEQRVTEFDARFPGEDIPRPSHWSGFRVVPVQIEFWQDGAFRLHDSYRFVKDESGQWVATRLNP
ncbi:pyridoxamine 5'-phosphate oxidase [Aureimonas ureilytica]|uniref:Pyridoxine/pyridoxamine 5'-phosphate oxidase n=1 Tax=Aureimonas ureilytica TaxID=401562 RepID=A0A175RNW2_9HYPH|nr:pyridoxamine 5'-phosphate oxidase [Aureimonas ureilytica]KTR05475.1 pyridoxamine 5'-phosphate oxidase [Aureimonas ureilytica]